MCECVLVVGPQGAEDGAEEEEEENEQKRTITDACRPSIKTAATVHEMGHYPSTVYHYVVDKSMPLTVMILRYSKHKALRQSRCTVSTRRQRGSTRSEGARRPEGRV